jgi:hypothetical protein
MMETYDVPLDLLGFLIENTFDEGTLQAVEMGEYDQGLAFSHVLARAYDRMAAGADVHVTITVSEGEALIGARVH